MSQELLILSCVLAIPFCALSVVSLVVMILNADDFHFSDDLKDLLRVLSPNGQLDAFRRFMRKHLM